MEKKRENGNVIYVDGPEEAARNNRSRKLQRDKRMMALTVVVLILAVILGVVIYCLINRQYKGYKVLKSNDTKLENTANYTQFSDNLLKYTPDGASYINSNGDTVWSAGINMKMPIAVTCGNYAAIADIGGNNVCIFNEKGPVSSLTMPYTICDVDVANQGAFAVVLESDKTNYINLYDKNGKMVYEMQTTIDKSGYPLDITISDDGKKLFTSYINIGGTSITNSLGAYNFGDVGQNSNADRMVGGYTFNDQVIPKVEFIDNNTIVAFGTNGISIYSMKEKPSLKAEIDVENEIKSIFYNEGYVGIIQAVNDPESEHLYKVKVYNTKGKLEFDAYIDFEYKDIYAAKKEIIIYGGSDCIIYRKNGSCKFNGKLSGDIQSIVPNGNRLEYVVAYSNKTEIIKLKSEPQVQDISEDTTDDIGAVPTVNNVGGVQSDDVASPEDVMR
ncbi:MAG: DUF5711 family protein [Wujia sp.]